jgi:hypothetical protein
MKAVLKGQLICFSFKTNYFYPQLFSTNSFKVLPNLITASINNIGK